MSADQLVHQIMRAGSQPDPVPFRYGHIASYDPNTHKVRCIIPSLTDQEGNPTLSGWMPIGTASAGPGYGFQAIYQGGATIDNPTAGEQVLIANFDKRHGVAAVVCTFYGGGIDPPNVNLPQQSDGYSTSADAGQPGDFIISVPPANQGGGNSFIRLRKNGQIQIWSAGQMEVDVQGGLTAMVTTGDLNVTVAQGDANVKASGTVNLLGSAVNLGKAMGDAFLNLCTTMFQTAYNSHTHIAGDSPTSPPIIPAGPDTMTSIVKAE